MRPYFGCIFFLIDTATTEIYTLSLHDALPICSRGISEGFSTEPPLSLYGTAKRERGDRKSTRLNSSHSQNSYAVFCLKKKNRWWAIQRQPLPLGGGQKWALPGTGVAIRRIPYD